MGLARAFLILALAVWVFPVSARGIDDASGRVLYRKHCAECHGPEGRGDGPTAEILTRQPADLTSPELWAASSDEEVIRFVLGGRRLRLELRPGALRRHAEETEAVYAFLRRLSSTDWERVEAGEGVYLDRCLPCHDAYGHAQRARPAGTQAPRDLSDPQFQSALTDEDLVGLVRHGGNGMPALVPRVTTGDARLLVAYVRVLSPGYELYDRYCLACHGPYGQGARGLLEDASGPEVAFDEAYFARRSPDEIRERIWHMLREKNQWMPRFAGVLDETDVRRILSYVRSLPRHAGSSTRSPPSGSGATRHEGPIRHRTG